MLFIILPLGVIGERRYSTGWVSQTIKDYPWSSYLDYLNLRKSNISNLEPSFVLHLIDNNTSKSIKKYREYIIQHQDMKDPLQQSYRNIALGSEEFIERVKEKDGFPFSWE